jgi:hypothetical protein
VVEIAEDELSELLTTDHDLNDFSWLKGDPSA